uniref:Uncharacterized protein n=1 Tax=Leersia perrieri TaxID=77586 RepID=A0A0D9VEB3_9ORYZ
MAHPLLEDDDLLGGYSSASRRVPPPSRAPPPSANAAAASSPPTPPSSAASAPATAATRPSSASSPFARAASPSIPPRIPPDRVPAIESFHSPLLDLGNSSWILGCRDGLVLIINVIRRHFLVWDPVSGEHRRVDFSSDLDQDEQSSETGRWGNLISAAFPSNYFFGIETHVPGVMIGDSLYWLIYGLCAFILELDLKEQMLAVIELPMGVTDCANQCWRVKPAEEGGGLGLVSLSNPGALFWKMKNKTGAGVLSGWVEEKIDKAVLDLTHYPSITITIMGFAEDYNVVFLRPTAAVFMVHLKSMEFKAFAQTKSIDFIYPFASRIETLTTHRHLASAMAHPLLEVDDLLAEILLRLPPRPSSLPRAAAVCNRWRRLVSDPGFLRRFRARHRRDAPLLGFFISRPGDAFFVPTMDPPDRVPWPRLVLGVDSRILGCRDGLVLILNPTRRHFLVCDPVSGERRRVGFPSDLDGQSQAEVRNGAVFRSAGVDDARGGGGLFPFQIALVASALQEEEEQAIGCIYSSETGRWGNLTSMTLSPRILAINTHVPGVMIGDSIYWFFYGVCGCILEFDLKEQMLLAIELPMGVTDDSNLCSRVKPAEEDGGLGLVSLSNLGVLFWKRKTVWKKTTGGSDYAVSRWVEERRIKIDKAVLRLADRWDSPFVMGFAEDYNVIFLRSTAGVFMVHLKSMEIMALAETIGTNFVYPFSSVYTAASTMDPSGGHGVPSTSMAP